MYFITNNTAKIRLKILGRTFRLTSGAIVNAKKLTLCWVYPSRFIDRCIRQFLNKKLSQHPKTQTQTCNHFTFKLSYQGNISHNIEKELQQFIMKQLPDSKLRFIHTTTKLKHCFHTKDPQSHLRRSNLVYRLILHQTGYVSTIKLSLFSGAMSFKSMKYIHQPTMHSSR